VYPSALLDWRRWHAERGRRYSNTISSVAADFDANLDGKLVVAHLTRRWYDRRKEEVCVCVCVWGGGGSVRHTHSVIKMEK
jgi:hypothetical protein